ncbi:hypothetical protein K9U39_03615 [Rhodoblastus acidophilus]|uniref:Uncharacterized protein n=1 Tax=Candidatus Rhodoblastus alkanivorans TaxID=2954117 RepID=A0ABS9Z4Y0_9HYPH|nr:hypothetical protein [Candidatus Rhodoblastus alkanivorans]MCI4679859.1 hypothetical protein [Candidatus Rhodoblastus alkanivorans]MCI4682738.1 hypothetical protein [Candidatus Rhodoblastus alkanivorans]MDI4640045.1 hypothetical protein [Rhodoblastus acidophilus]
MSLFSYGFLRSETRDQNSRFIRIEENRLRSALRALLLEVEMDEKWYFEAYSDVRAAFKQGKIASAREHYVESGYFEDRWPRPMKVDSAWYLKTYPDIADGVRSGKFASAQEHFETHGFREGRKPSPGWTLLSDVPTRPQAGLNR